MNALLRSIGIAAVGLTVAIACGGKDDGGDDGNASGGSGAVTITGGSSGTGGARTGGSGGSNTGGATTGGSSSGGGAGDESGGTMSGGNAGAGPGECPATAPDDGDSCSFDQVGMTCSGCTCGFGGGGGGFTWDCGGAGTGGAGGAPADECPATAPEDGDSCEFGQMDLECDGCTCEFGGGELSWNCGGGAGGAGTGGAGGAPADECPATAPQDGDSCEFGQMDLECDGCTCGGGGPGGLSWDCGGGAGGAGTGGAGGAPAEECPATAPQDGDSCEFGQMGLECDGCSCEFGGGELSWNCGGGAAGAGPGGGAGASAGGAGGTDCPATEPTVGEPCTPLGGGNCPYGDVTCTCPGGGPNAETWQCA